LKNTPKKLKIEFTNQASQNEAIFSRLFLEKTAEALDFVCNFDGQIGIPPIQDLL
jgi:hypothetical protein